MNKLKYIFLELIPTGLFGLAFGVGVSNIQNPNAIRLFTIGPLYYDGYSWSLMIFSMFGVYLVWKYESKAIPMLMVTYGSWELAPMLYTIHYTQYELVFVFFVLFGLYLAKPKFPHKALGFLAIGGILYVTQSLDTDLAEIVYELLWITYIALAFRPSIGSEQAASSDILSEERNSPPYFPRS